MKKILLFTLALIITNLLYSQFHISTKICETFSWNQGAWVLTNQDNEVSTLFDFNKEMTMFTHTTATISSSYYIKSSSHTEEKIWEYDIVSDVGNNYHFILDLKNNNLRFIGKNKDGSLFLVRHTIKRSWSDD
jgi:hypothetical protein